MTARRKALTVAGSSFALVALAGCQKPTPAVTLVADGERVRSESTVWCRDGQSIAARNCVTRTSRLTVLRVKQGAQVGVDVDRTLATHGWYLVDTDASQRSAVQNEHYFTFNADFANRKTPGVINLDVRSVDRVAEKATVTGSWRFQLVQK